MRSLHFLVPGLFWPDMTDPRPYTGLELPALERMLAKGRRQAHPVAGVEDWLGQQWGFPSSPAPFAALLVQRDDRQAGDAVWMCADPVNMQARGAEIFLTAGESLDIGEAEAAALIEALNTFFAPDGLSFLAIAPDRWVARLPAQPDMQTTALSAAHGRPIDRLLPQGDGALPWIKRLNEAQMLLHGHPVNTAREDAGRPLVNSLWFWGPGRYVAPSRRPADRLFSDDPLVTALGRASETEALPAPDNAQPVLAAATRESVLFEYSGCRRAADSGDVSAWQCALQAFDEQFLEPALTALGTGMLDRLKLTGISGQRSMHVHLGRLDLLRFWRRGAKLGVPA